MRGEGSLSRTKKVAKGATLQLANSKIAMGPAVGRILGSISRRYGMPFLMAHFCVPNKKEASKMTNKTLHFCAVQANIEEEICCQLIRLLNVPEKVPFCNFGSKKAKIGINFRPQNSSMEFGQELLGGENRSASVTSLFQRSYPKFGPPSPSMNLKTPPDEVPEEHLTFLFGVFMLISMAVICTLFLMKLAKAGSPDSSIRFNSRCFGGILPPDYSLMLWMPRGNGGHHHHRPSSSVATHRMGPTRRNGHSPSLLLLLRNSFRCADGAPSQSSAENDTESTSAASIPSSSYGGGGRSIRNVNAVGGCATGWILAPTGRRKMPRSGRSCVSIVSSSSMNALLPNTITPSSSSGSAGLAGLASLNACTSTPNSSAAIPPPPCYEELEEFSNGEIEKGDEKK